MLSVYARIFRIHSFDTEESDATFTHWTMGPSNEHELAIARIVDQLSMDGKLFPTAVPQIVAALDFMMSRSDSEFLVRYLQWRMANPIPKPPQ